MKYIKRLAGTLIGGMVLAISAPAAFADSLFGVYAGAGSWQQKFSGELESGNLIVDLEGDLGVAEENNSIVYLAMEHGFPLLPNVRGQFMQMDVDGRNVLSRTIDFNGTTFALSEGVSTAVELDQSDAVFYYQLTDTVISLDGGLALSYIEGQIDVESTTLAASADFDELVPMLYGRARADLPLSGFWVAAEAQGINYDGNGVLEYSALVGYESDSGLGIEAGYRAVQIELDEFEDVSNAEIDIDGPYLALNYHF